MDRLRLLTAVVLVLGVAGAAQAVPYAWGSVDWDTNSTTDGACWWDDAGIVPDGETPRAYSGWYYPGGLNDSGVSAFIKGPYAVTVSDSVDNLCKKLEISRPATTVESPDKPYTADGSSSITIDGALTVASALNVNADYSQNYSHTLTVNGKLDVGTLYVKNDSKGGTGTATWTISATGVVNAKKLTFVNATFEAQALLGTISGGMTETAAGNLELNANSVWTSGTLEMDIFGDGDNDVLYAKDKTLALGNGAEMLLDLNGYTPAVGDTWMVATSEGGFTLQSGYVIETPDGDLTYNGSGWTDGTSGLWGAEVVAITGNVRADAGLELTYVPEPATAVLLGFGGLGLLARRRRT